ncbi:prepilin-type N-terminal cleavage/methylation domain-containing protein [Candidatus Sumerlaeota bacterium]|nr:prepilin-type N-terminal cleavage/methylation domain-containing protein [Candidatus Sumerlaeota bacterium]
MKSRSAKGFTLVEIMIVVAIIGVIIAIAIPGFMRAREVSRATACQENLVKIEGAVDQWAVEYDKKDGDSTDWAALVGKTLYLKKTPKCRGGGNYSVPFAVGTTPSCDYTTPGWFDTQGQRYQHVVPEAKD